jgi:hypothetical protein
MIKRVIGYAIMTIVVLTIVACFIIGFHTKQDLLALGLAIAAFLGISGLWYIGKTLAEE